MQIDMIEARALRVEPIVEELEACPWAWNQHRQRTEHPKSPHRDVDDIWVRYNSFENYHGDMPAFNEKHVPQWYPVSKALPSVKLASEWVMRRVEGEELGCVLITRIPPRKCVYPHIDSGWHARTFDKFCLQIKSNQLQAFCFAGEELRAEPGDLYWFDNSYSHWVVNPSNEERISLIVCVRSAKCH